MAEQYFSIPLPNYPALVELQDHLKKQMPDATFQDPATFHITLAYVEDDLGQDLSDVAVAENLPAFIVMGDYITKYETPNGAAVVLEITKSPQLIYLQAAIFYELKQRGVTLSGYSWPNLWRAHITLASLPTYDYEHIYMTGYAFVPVDGYSVSTDGDQTVARHALQEAYVSGFKSMGDKGWVGFFSNIFPDRDVRPDAPQGERFELDALKEYSEWANSDPANLPELWLWHMPNVKMGKADEVAVVGPFIVAWGGWGSDPIGQAAKAYYATHPEGWGMSHGFHYQTSDRVAGTYKRFRTHEVTAIPVEWSANPLTAFMEDKAMAEKGMMDDLKRSVMSVLGLSEEQAGKVVQQGIDQEKAAKSALPAGTQVGQKEADPAPADAPADEADPAEVQGLIDALADGQEAKQRVVALEKQVGDLTKAVGQLVEVVNAQTKAITDADTQRKGLLPRAVSQALAQRAAADKSSAEPPAAEAGDIQPDVQKQAMALTGEEMSGDVLGAFLQQAIGPLNGKQ
jgi:hypothetical protein